MEDIEKEIAGEEVQDEQLIKEEALDNQEDVKEEDSDRETSDDDDFFDEKKRKEDDTIRFSKRGSNDDKKRNIIIIILIVVAVLLIGVIGVLALTKKDNNTDTNKDNTSNETKEVVKEEDNSKKVSYVSCDDNTSLLNVRNSSTGDIIDGLSCFKEVEVLEEIEGTDTCDKWYRVSYQKSNNSYTGYVCSKYIKDSSSDSTSIKKMKEVIEKANKYYEDILLHHRQCISQFH